MILYHGSNVTVSEPRLVEQNRYLDVGYGFYTTTNKTQAIGFADKVTKRRKSGERTVSIYEIDEGTAFAECSILKFESANEAWLDFVSENRSGNYSGEDMISSMVPLPTMTFIQHLHFIPQEFSQKSKLLKH